MAHGVATLFVHPGVEGREVIILDFIFTFRFVIQFDRIGPNPVKSVARFQRWGQGAQTFQELSDVGTLFFQLVPLTFLHFHHSVALVS